jgi:hypothetical protein
MNGSYSAFGPIEVNVATPNGMSGIFLLLYNNLEKQKSF